MLLLLLLLAACGADECNVVSVDVADDAPLGDLPFTAGDAAAEAVGTYDLTVSTASEGWVAATLDVRRGDGPAVFEDAEFTQRLDFDDVWPFSQDYDLQPACQDRVEVPVRVTLDVPDIGLDLAIDGWIEPPPGSLDALHGVDLHATIPLDTPGLPTPPEGTTSVYFRGGFFAAEIRSLQFSWDTVDESQTIVQFPVEGEAR
ncbi:MAG: hypothetical protein ACK4YP_13535 [Myxococcota bacterium]